MVLWHAVPLWWGPEDLLEYFHLQYFFQETDEALRKKKKKKDPRDDGQKCLLQCFTNVIGFH